jgi:hypothetical protein
LWTWRAPGPARMPAEATAESGAKRGAAIAIFQRP